MMWFFAVLVVLALGGVALLAAGRGAPMVEAVGLAHLPENSRQALYSEAPSSCDFHSGP